jgi:hypothetical protein
MLLTVVMHRDASQDDQEEFEIDLNDDEPEFLKGHSSRSGIEMSPIKIVKNPEGSMQRAAMTAVSGQEGGDLRRCNVPSQQFASWQLVSDVLIACFSCMHCLISCLYILWALR